MNSTSPVWRNVACLILFSGTLLLFSGVVNHEFLDCDDPDYVTQNRHVQAGLSLEGARWAFTSGEAANWHPLTWLSHMLDRQLFGAGPRGPHATNVVLHALNAVLAFLVLRKLTGSFWLAAFNAAFFAWHPLRVESVAWVAERKDLLCGFFGLAAIWAYAAYAERRRAGKPARAFFAMMFLAFLLGLLSKPMLVTLPFLLLVLDWWPLQRLGRVHLDTILDLYGLTKHLTPALSPFCSADSAKRGEGETLPAVRHGEAVWFKDSVKMHPSAVADAGAEKRNLRLPGQ